MRFSRFIIGLTAGIALSAQAANIDEYITQLPAGANLAFMAQKVGASTPEIDYHSQQMALPASTQKVITALAALLQLGPDFRFTTTLETKGSLDGGVLKGDLIARFGGDPTACSVSTAMCLSIPRSSPAMIKRRGGRGTT